MYRLMLALLLVATFAATGCKKKEPTVSERLGGVMKQAEKASKDAAKEAEKAAADAQKKLDSALKK